MEIVGKIVLMPKGTYDPTATYKVLDWVRYNGVSWVCKVDNTSGVTPVEGTNWTVLAQDGATSGSINWANVNNRPFNSLGDGLATDSNDVLSVDVDGTTIVIDSTTKKLKAVGGGGGGASDWSQLSNKPFESLSTDFDVPSTGADKDKLKLATSVTSKLSAMTVPQSTDNGKVLTAKNDGTTEWKDAKGGHDMLTTVPSVEAITSATDDHVVSAYVVKGYSNRYTIGIESTLTANNNEITITDNAFKNDDATFEFMFEPTLNASSEYEVLTLSKYELNTSTGTIKLTLVEAPTVNTKVRVDVTVYREEI